MKSNRLEKFVKIDDEKTIYAFAGILTLVLYWPILFTGLLSDDWGVAFADRPFASLHGHWFGGEYGRYYRPLSRISIYLQGLIFGANGIIPHVISLLLFLATALFTGLTLKRWGYGLAGAVAALLIVIHPGNVETVAWISSQTDLNVCFFFALIAYFLSPSLTPARIIMSFVAAVLCYLSKDNSIFVGPTVLLGCGAWLIAAGFSTVKSKEFLLTAGGHLLLWVGYLGARKFFLGEINPSDPPVEGLVREFPSFNLANLITVYNELLSPVLPWFSNTDKGYLLSNGGPSWWFWVSMSALVIILWIKKERVLAALLVLFFIFCVPVIMAPHPYFLESLKTSRRYLWAPMLAFGPIIAVAILRKESTLKPLLVLGLFLIVQAWGLESSRNISDWVMAGKIRGKIKADIDSVANRSLEPINLYPVNVPHRFYNAFVFQNGLEEFVKYYYNNKVILMPPVAPGQPIAQSPLNFRLEFKNLEAPSVIRN